MPPLSTPVLFLVSLSGMAGAAQGLKVFIIISPVLKLWDNVIAVRCVWLVSNRGNPAITQTLLAQVVIPAQDSFTALLPLGAIASLTAAATRWV